MATPYLPMLASSGPFPAADGWSFEVKWDGVRALVCVDGGQVRVLTRRGNDITAAFPELAGLAHVLPDGSVADGELVVLDANSRPSFGAVAGRLHARHPQVRAPACLMLFDLVRDGNRDLCGHDYETRRQLLVERVEPAARWQVTPATNDGEALLASTREIGLEGVIAKRRTSNYTPGRRSRDWVKAKHVEVSAVRTVAARRDGTGRLSAVLVATADGTPACWVDRVEARCWTELHARMPAGRGVVRGEGPIVAVQHLAGSLARESRVVAVHER